MIELDAVGSYRYTQLGLALLGISDFSFTFSIGSFSTATRNCLQSYYLPALTCDETVASIISLSAGTAIFEFIVNEDIGEDFGIGCRFLCRSVGKIVYRMCLVYCC